MGKVIDISVNIAPKHIREARKHLQNLPEQKAKDLLTFVAGMLLDEIKEGVAGEDEGPFFKMVDAIYEESKAGVPGCYLCDQSIDPNETAFTENSKLCMTCRLKLGKIMKAMKTKGE